MTRRPAMRALASEFPGALREIDEIPLDEIDRRIAHLGGLLARRPTGPQEQEGSGQIEGWEAAHHRFHTLLRGNDEYLFNFIDIYFWQHEFSGRLGHCAFFYCFYRFYLSY